jgi:hypothetical protein
MPVRKKTSRKKAARGHATGGFVGRDASPVLDKYPPKDPSLSPAGPPRPAPAAPRAAEPVPSPTAPAGATPPTAPAAPLITLERPFDVDEFASLLGETSIRVTVPRENLADVLARATEFMGFGIYVYAISVRPAPSDLLKAFVVELQRVDYSPARGEWVPFTDKGTSDSPFGPSGTRT